MPPVSSLFAGLLVLGGVLVLTAIVIATLRQRDGAAARHYANLTLPFGLLPLLVALLLTQPRALLAPVVMLVAVLTVTSTAESHIVGRLTFLSRRRETRLNDESAPKAAESLEE